MADQNQDQRAQDYINSLKPEEGITGATLLPDGEVVQVEKDEDVGFWDGVKNFARDTKQFFSNLGSRVFGDIDNTQEVFNNATFNGEKIGEDNKPLIQNYYNSLKKIQDFEKNGLNNANDIMEYNNAKGQLGLYKFAEKGDEKILKDNMYDQNIITEWGLGRDEQGNSTNSYTNNGLRIVRHGVLQEEMGSKETDKYISDVKQNVAEKLIQQGYQANMNPGGRESTVDEVVADLDSAFSTVGSLGARLQAYTDVINYASKRDYQTANEYKRLTDGLVDMVGYILADNTGRSSEAIMREYIDTVGNPMQIDASNFTSSDTRGARNAKITEILTLGNADAYQTALGLKGQYELDDHIKQIKNADSATDVLAGAGGALWDLVGLGGSAVGTLASGVFSKLPALGQYAAAKKTFLQDEGFKENRGYDIPSFTSYVYGWTDSGIRLLKSRVQKGVETEQDVGKHDKILYGLNVFYSGVDDIVASVVGAKGLGFSTKAPGLVKAGVKLVDKVDDVAKVANTASTVMKNTAKVEKAVTVGEQIQNVIPKNKGMANFLKQAGNAVLNWGKGKVERMFITPAKEMKTAWGEFKLLGGAGMNVNKAEYLAQTVLKWVGEEALQSAYFNGLTSQPYTKEDMWMDVAGSIFGAYERVASFKSNFLNISQSSNNTKWAVFGMQELLKMNGDQIEKVLKKASTNPSLLEELGESVKEHIKPYLKDVDVATTKHVRTASQNLASDVRRGLMDKVDNMVLQHDQTFLKALSESSDIRHNAAVKKITHEDGTVSYEWSKNFDERLVSALKRSNIKARKEKAYEDVFAPRRKTDIDRILRYKNLVNENLALYAKQYFPNSVIRNAKGKWVFKKGISKEQQRNYFTYILHKILNKEGLNRAELLQQAIDHDRTVRRLFKGKMGEKVSGELSEASLYTGSVFSNFSDRIRHFINTMAVAQEKKAKNYLVLLDGLGAWVGLAFKWRCKKYKNVNPESIQVKELEDLLQEYGRLFDESIAQEFKEDVYHADKVNIPNSIANKTYKEACKENPNLVNMDVDVFWRIIDSDLEGEDIHNLLKNYKKNDILYKDKIINLKNGKPTKEEYKNSFVFNSAEEERATLGNRGSIDVPKQGYRIENGDVIMDTSADNMERYSYNFVTTHANTGITVYTVHKDKEQLGIICTRGSLYGNNPNARMMWFVPKNKAGGFELKDFKFTAKGFPQSLANSSTVKYQKQKPKKIDIDPKKFTKEKNIQQQIREEEVKGSEPVLLTQGEWTKINSDIKEKVDYRKFVDDTNPFVSRVIDKKTYKNIVNSKEYTDTDKFQIVSSLISMGKNIDEGIDIKNGFLGDLPIMVQDYIVSNLPEGSFIELNIKGLETPIECVALKSNDGTNNVIHIYDVASLKPVGEVKVGKEKGYVMIEGQRKEIDNMRYTTPLPEDAVKKFRLYKDNISDFDEIKNFESDMEVQLKEIPDKRKEVLDFARTFFKELGFKNFNETLKNIYSNNLTKEEVVLRTIDNISIDNSFRLRAVNKFKNFLSEAYADPEVIGRKLKYELNMADECQNYKNSHPNITLEDVELHKCMERYDEIKSNGFVLNASEKEIADVIFGKDKKGFSRDELISVIGASLFEKPQKINKVTLPMRLLQERSNRLIQFLTKDPESKKWPEEVKRNFLNHTKEFVDLTTRSVEDIVADVNTHPENYIEMLQHMKDDYKTRTKGFDIKKDVKKRDTISKQLEDAQKKYEELKAEYDEMKFKRRQWMVDGDYYPTMSRKFEQGAQMCDDIIDESKKMLSNALRLKNAITEIKDFDVLLDAINNLDILRVAYRNNIVNELKELNSGIPGFNIALDQINDAIEQKGRFIRLSQEAKKRASIVEQGTVKSILEQATEDDFKKVMLQTLTGNGVTNRAIFSKEQFNKAMKQLKSKLATRQIVMIGDNGIEYTRNMRDAEMNAIMNNFIKPKAEQILYGKIGGSTHITGFNGRTMASILYPANNQNIVGIGHEWFHSVIHTLCNEEEIRRTEQLLDNTYKKYKGVIDANASKTNQLQKYIEDIKNATSPKEKKQLKKVYERIATEEWLADRYGEYVAGKLELDDSAIIALFKMIRQRIQALLTPEITQFFDDIYEGRVSNAIPQRNLFASANIKQIGVKRFKEGEVDTNDNTLNTLDMFISDESSNEYALNPVTLCTTTPIEQINDLIKNDDLRGIIYALQGSGYGRLPSIMGVDGRSFMTEGKKAIKAFKSYEVTALGKYASIMNEQFVNNIVAVCDMQNKNGQINYRNSWNGNNFTINVNVGDVPKFNSVYVSAEIVSSNGTKATVCSSTFLKNGNVLQNIKDRLNLVDGKFNLFQREALSKSFVNTNKYKQIVKNIPEIVSKSIERNISIPMLPEYSSLDKRIKNAITDCYRLSIFNNQIPHSNYLSFNIRSYFIDGNPLEDLVYRPLELGINQFMYVKKDRDIFNIINKYKSVDGINIYKYNGTKGDPSLYVRMDIDGAEVGFNFHIERGVVSRLEYQNLPTYPGIPESSTWEQYPLSFTKSEIINNTERFKGESLYERLSTSAFLNEFLNTLVSDGGPNIHLIGKTKVSQDGIKALALYTNNTRLNGFDGGAKLYYTSNPDDAKVIVDNVEKNGKETLLVNVDVHPAVLYQNMEKFKNDPNKVLVLTGGTNKVKYSIVDSNYLDTKIGEINNNILQHQASRDSLLSIDSLDKEIISDINRLDQIDTEIKESRNEIHKLEKKKIKSKRNIEDYDPRLEEIEEELKAQEEKNMKNAQDNRQKQKEYLSSLGLDIYNRDQFKIAEAENKLKELNQRIGYYMVSDPSKLEEAKIQRNALEFYLDPIRENTTVLLRPDTETFDASGNYVKDVMSEGYYNDLVRDFFDDYPDVGPDNAVEAYELAKDIYDTIPRTHDILLDKTRVKLDDFYDEETNEYNYDAIYGFLKGVRTLFYKDREKQNLQYIPREIRDKISYRDEIDKSETKYDEEGNIMYEIVEEEGEDPIKEKDIANINQLYKQYSERKNFDELTYKEKNNIYDGLLSDDPSEVNNSILELYYALEKDVTEKAIDFMYDKEWSNVPISDMIGEAKSELLGILNRLPDATLKGLKIADGLKKGKYTIQDVIEGSDAIRGGTTIHGVSVKGITDRLKSIFDSYLPNSQGENRATVAFTTNLKKRIEDIVQQTNDMEGSNLLVDDALNSGYFVERAFNDWKADQLKKQLEYVKSADKARENVDKQLRKIFPEEDYPNEITADDVKLLMGSKQISLGTAVGDEGTTLGDILEDKDVVYGTDWLEQKENAEEINRIRNDISELKQEKESLIQEVNRKFNVNDKWKGIDKTDSIEGLLDKIKEEDIINIQLSPSAGKKETDPIALAYALYLKKYGEEGRKVYSNVEAANTIHTGRTGMISNFGIDISDQFSLKELSQVGLNIGSAKNLVGDFDYWLGDLPLNMGIRSERGLGLVSYYDCVEAIKNNPSLSDAKRLDYENTAADAVWFNMTNTKSLIVDKNRFHLLRNHFGADETKELLKEVNIAYELYRIKVYINRRIKNKNIRTILNDRFNVAWNNDANSKYIGRTKDGMYFKGELAKLLGERTFKFSDMIDRNPLEVVNKRMSLPKQLSKYLNESVLFDVVNPSIDKNGNDTLFVMDNQGVKNNLKSKDYIGRRCRTQQEVNETSLRMKNAGYYPVVINVNRAGIASSDFNENVVNEVPYDKIKFIIKLDNKKINNINFSHLGDRRGLFLVQGSAAKADDYTAPTSKALWVKYRKEVEGLEDDFAKNVIDEKKVETKPEEIEVDESSVVEEADDATRTFEKEKAEAIKLQLHSYSKNWLKSINLWDDVKKKFHKVYAQRYGDYYYLIADRKGKTPSGLEYQSTDIIATIIDADKFYNQNGFTPNVSDRAKTVFKLNTFGNNKYNIWPSSETQDLDRFDQFTGGYSYPVLLVKNLNKAKIKKLQFSNYEFDVANADKGKYTKMIDDALDVFGKETIPQLTEETNNILNSIVDTVKTVEQKGDSGISVDAQKQLLKQQVDYELKKYETIDLSGIELPDLSKKIKDVGSLNDNIFNQIGYVVVGKTNIDTNEVSKSTNEFMKKYRTIIDMVSTPNSAGEKFQKTTRSLAKKKKDLDSLYNKQQLANDIAEQGNEIKKIQAQLNDVEKNINTKINNDVAYKNSVAYKNQLKIEGLLKQAKKNIKPKKNKIEIQGQEGTTNKIIEVKPEYNYGSVVLPFGKISEGFEPKNFLSKIITTKKAQSALLPEEKNIAKTYGDFKVYPYNGDDVDFLTKIQDLKDEGNFVLMTSDPYNMLCAEYKIVNKFPDVEMVYKRQEGNVAYFIKKELTEAEDQEIKEYVNEATSVGETTNNLSSYCNIK